MHEHQIKHTHAQTTLAFCHHSTQDSMICTNTHIEGDKGSVQKLKRWVQFGWFQFSRFQKEAVSFFSVLPPSSNPWLIFSLLLSCWLTLSRLFAVSTTAACVWHPTHSSVTSWTAWDRPSLLGVRHWRRHPWVSEDGRFYSTKASQSDRNLSMFSWL